MVIIFPTDTVYGIGTKIFDTEGIKKIYEIKNRPLSKPLACLCADMKQIDSIAILTDDARKLISAFLPGALTLILQSKEEVYNKIGYKTIGVRIPDSKVALAILKENGPMLTTSVNESGSVPLNEYDEIYERYNSLVDKIYAPCGNSLSIASTVVLVNEDGIKILREGPVTKDAIEKVLKNE